MTTQISETLHHEYCKNISLVLTYYHKSCAYFVAYSQTLTKEVIRLKKKSYLRLCIAYISLSWCIVQATGVKCVARVLDDLWGVKDREDRAQGSSVPVVSHSPAVVTLTGHVTEGIKRHFLYNTINHSFHKST